MSFSMVLMGPVGLKMDGLDSAARAIITEVAPGSDTRNQLPRTESAGVSHTSLLPDVVPVCPSFSITIANHRHTAPLAQLYDIPQPFPQRLDTATHVPRPAMYCQGTNTGAENTRGEVECRFLRGQETNFA